MKKKKVVFSIITILLIAVSSFAAFFFTRSKVAFYIDPLEEEYIDNLIKPSFLNLTYRTKVVTDPSDSYLESADFIIDHSVNGLENFNSYRVQYDPISLIEPYINQIESGATYLYEERDPLSLEVLSYLESAVDNLISVPYSHSVERSMYGIYSERIGQGLIISLSLNETIGFIRSLGDRDVAITYLDAAALEAFEPKIVFAPSWDSIIRESLLRESAE